MFLLIQSAQAIKPWISSVPSGENLNKYCGLNCLAMLGVSVLGMTKFKDAVDTNVVHTYSFTGNHNGDAALGCYFLTIISASLALYVSACKPFTANKL